MAGMTRSHSEERWELLPAALISVTPREPTFGVRAKIAQDLLDRAGLVAAQVHKIVPTAEDPVMRFFEDVFSDPSNWVSNTQPDPAPAIESYATSSRDHHDVEPEELGGVRSSSQKVSQPTTRRRGSQR
jgi:hypothetical protein